MLLNDVKILVIDERIACWTWASSRRRRIVSWPNKIRQTLFFSTTMPAEIKRLADSFLINPKEITVTQPAPRQRTLNSIYHDYTNRRDLSGLQKAKRDALQQVISRESVKNALIFATVSRMSTLSTSPCRSMVIIQQLCTAICLNQHAWKP